MSEPLRTDNSGGDVAPTEYSPRLSDVIDTMTGAVSTPAAMLLGMFTGSGSEGEVGGEAAVTATTDSVESATVSVPETRRRHYTVDEEDKGVAQAIATEPARGQEPRAKSHLVRALGEQSSRPRSGSSSSARLFNRGRTGASSDTRRVLRTASLFLTMETSPAYALSSPHFGASHVSPQVKKRRGWFGRSVQEQAPEADTSGGDGLSIAQPNANLGMCPRCLAVVNAESKINPSKMDKSVLICDKCSTLEAVETTGLSGYSGLVYWPVNPANADASSLPQIKVTLTEDNIEFCDADEHTLTVPLKWVWVDGMTERGFDVTTPVRTYHIYARTNQEKELWVSSIEDATRNYLEAQVPDLKGVDSASASHDHPLSRASLAAGVSTYDTRHGVYRFKDLSTATGVWKSGLMEGTGSLVFANGCRYDGCFSDGRIHGEGSLTYPNQAHFSGRFDDGIMHGQGVYNFPDGHRYSGAFEKGVRSGHGTLIGPPGSSQRYEGQWEGDRRNGQGTEVFPDESRYVGHWRNDARHGHGRLTKESNSDYFGQWEDGERSGAGRQHEADGTEYSGWWLHDKKHGFGACKLPDNTEMIGWWEAGERHGQGTLIMPEGALITGEWTTADQPDGVLSLDKAKFYTPGNWIGWHKWTSFFAEFNYDQGSKEDKRGDIDWIRNLADHDDLSLPEADGIGMAAFGPSRRRSSSAAELGKSPSGKNGQPYVLGGLHFVKILRKGEHPLGRLASQYAKFTTTRFASRILSRDSAVEDVLVTAVSDIHAYLDCFCHVVITTWKELQTPDRVASIRLHATQHLFAKVFPVMFRMYKVKMLEKDMEYMRRTDMFSEDATLRDCGVSQGIVDQLEGNGGKKKKKGLLSRGGGGKDDVPAGPLFSEAIAAAQALSEQRTPYGKMAAVMRIVDSVHSFASERLPSKYIEADDLLPILTYVLVKSRVPHLWAELAVVEDFAPDVSVGQAANAYVNILAALNLVTNEDIRQTVSGASWSRSSIDASSLSAGRQRPASLKAQTRSTVSGATVPVSMTGGTSAITLPNDDKLPVKTRRLSSIQDEDEEPSPVKAQATPADETL